MDNPTNLPREKREVRIFCCPQCGMGKGLTAVGRSAEIRTCELCDMNDTAFLYDLNSVPPVSETKSVADNSSSDCGCVVLVLGAMALYILGSWLLK